MNKLPLHRSAQAGRTWSTTWSASDFDPVQAYPRVSTTERALGVVVAVVVGIVGAVSLVHWWAA